MNSSSSPGLNHKHIPVLQLLLFLVSLTATNVTEAIYIGPKLHETVINCLEPATDLTVHCKSKDDDLGIHVLQPGGKFSFSFKPNFWGTTLFFCSMDWKSSTLKYFDIFDVNRDRDYYYYNWNISANGPCLYNWDTKQFDKCYQWN